MRAADADGAARGGGGGRRNQDGGGAAVRAGGAAGGDAQGRGQGGADAQGRGGTRRLRQSVRRRPQEDDAICARRCRRHPGRAREAAKGNVGPDGQGGHHPGPGTRTGTRRRRARRRAAGGGRAALAAGGRRPVAASAASADPIAAMLRRGANVGGYTEEDRKNAKLPLPPEQDSQVQVLLRPGLLADVEIQVEKLPDVIHVPAQAVFQKNGKYLVYVQARTASSSRAPVQLVKQSESMMVIAERREGGRDRRHGRSHRRQEQEERREESPRPAPPWAAWAGGNRHGTFQYRS